MRKITIGEPQADNDDYLDASVFARWVEAMEPVPVTPLLSRWGPPLYARETIYRQVQPYYDQYDALYRKIGATLTTDEDGFWDRPDPRFWKPSRKMAKRLRRLAELNAKRWEIIPNPDYDPEKAATWRESRRFNQQKIEVGQSYHPNLNLPRPAPAYNTAFSDQDGAADDPK